MSATDPALWVERKRCVHLDDGRRLAFVRQSSEGPSVLLIHGFTDTSRSFARLSSFLQGFDVIIPDMPGHGGSSWREADGVGGIADDMIALLDHLGIDEVSILGHSMGGAVGVALAARLGVRATALVILASSLTPRLPADGTIARLVARFADPIDPEDPFFDEWHACNQPVDPDFLAIARREAAAMPAAIWKEVLKGLAAIDLTAEAEAVQCPVLCLSGTDDPLFGVDHQRALSAGFADVVSVSLPGQGHNLHWEEPEGIADRVADFLTEVLESRAEPDP